MKKIFIDTVSLYPKIIISKNNTIENTIILNINSSNQISDLIIETIQNIFKKYQINEISTIIVITGPGSFTSLRIGISVAVGLKVSSNVKLHGFNAIDVLLSYSRLYYKNENVYVFIQSTNNQNFIAAYGKNNQLLLKPNKIEDNIEIFNDDVPIDSILISNEKIKMEHKSKLSKFSLVKNMDISKILIDNNLKDIKINEDVIYPIYISKK